MEEIYISTNISSAGPSPPEYSLLSIGACVVGDTTENFYKKLKPLNDNYVQPAINLMGYSLLYWEEYGFEPERVMKEFETWIKTVAKDKKPRCVSPEREPVWEFIDYYFQKYIGRNPFGTSGLEIKVDKKFQSTRKSSHQTLFNAIEQAKAFKDILDK